MADAGNPRPGTKKKAPQPEPNQLPQNPTPEAENEAAEESEDVEMAAPDTDVAEAAETKTEVRAEPEARKTGSLAEMLRFERRGVKRRR